MLSVCPPISLHIGGCAHYNDRCIDGLARINDIAQRLCHSDSVPARAQPCSEEPEYPPSITLHTGYNDRCIDGLARINDITQRLCHSDSVPARAQPCSEEPEYPPTIDSDIYAYRDQSPFPDKDWERPPLVPSHDQQCIDSLSHAPLCQSLAESLILLIYSYLIPVFTGARAGTLTLDTEAKHITPLWQSRIAYCVSHLNETVSIIIHDLDALDQMPNTYNLGQKRVMWLFALRNGKLVIATAPSSLLMIDPDRPNSPPTMIISPSSHPRNRCYRPDDKHLTTQLSDGTLALLWRLNQELRMVIANPKQPDQLLLSQRFNFSISTAICQSSDGTLAIGTQSGSIIIVDPKNHNQPDFPTMAGLVSPPANIDCRVIDPRDTYSLRYNYDEERNTVISLTATCRGTFLVGLNSRQIYELDIHSPDSPWQEAHVNIMTRNSVPLPQSYYSQVLTDPVPALSRINQERMWKSALSNPSDRIHLHSESCYPGLQHKALVVGDLRQTQEDYVIQNPKHTDTYFNRIYRAPTKLTGRLVPHERLHFSRNRFVVTSAQLPYLPKNMLSFQHPQVAWLPNNKIVVMRRYLTGRRVRILIYDPSQSPDTRPTCLRRWDHQDLEHLKMWVLPNGMLVLLVQLYSDGIKSLEIYR